MFHHGDWCTYRYHVGGVDGVVRSTAVGNNQLCRARFRIGRMFPGAVNRSHRDTVDTVGISIEIAVIVRRGAVARSKDKNRPPAIAAILHAVHDGALDQKPWGIHRLSVVGRSPGARVDVVMLIAVVDGGCFVRIVDRLGQDAQAGHPTVIGHPDTADIVLGRRNFTGASRAVLVIVQTWPGLGGLVVKVVGAFGVVIGPEIVAVHVQPIVNNGRGDTLTSNSFQPYAGHIQIMTDLNGVVQMPLVREDGIGDPQGRGDRGLH